MTRIFWNKKNILNMGKTLFLIIKMILERLQTHSISKLTSFKVRLQMTKIKESSKCLLKRSHNQLLEIFSFHKFHLLKKQNPLIHRLLQVKLKNSLSLKFRTVKIIISDIKLNIKIKLLKVTYH
jgi:hypothetical protein